MSADKPPKETAAPPESLSTADGIPAEIPKRTPVLTYLAVLFVAAFLMLLLAYFIQERNSQAEIATIRGSLGEFQTTDELLSAYRELEDRFAVLEGEHSDLELRLESAEQERDSLQQELTSTQRTLEETRRQLKEAEIALEAG